MFRAIQVILQAYDDGQLTSYGVELALDDYMTYQGDGYASVGAGIMYQAVNHSER